MRVFKDLDIVEHLGTGIRKILKKYDKSIYHFYPHFIRVSINYIQNEFEYDNKKSQIFYTGLGLTKVQEGIIGLIQDKPTITQSEMANLLGVTPRMIRYHLKELVDKNYITRIGANKKGEWKVEIGNKN